MHPLRQTITCGSLLSFVLLAVACNDVGGPTGSDTSERLERNRAKWQSIAVPDYDMQQQRICECLPETTGPMYIRVRDDTIAAMWVLASFEPVAQDVWQLFRSVNELFDAIRQAIDDGVDVLEVEYDEEFGYPAQLLIDPSVNVGDDEIMYTTVVLLGTL